MNPQEQRRLFLELAQAKMPFGKYKNRLLIDLPEYYLIWYKNKGFPLGKLGQQLQQIYEIKLNGLEYLLRTLLNKKL